MRILEYVMPVRLNHAWNIFCFAFFFCVMAGILFLTASLPRDPPVVIFVMIFAGLWGLVAAYRATQLSNRYMTPYSDSHEFSPNLRKIVDGLCAAAGKKPSEVPVYGFDHGSVEKLDMTSRRRLYTYMVSMQTHNALARSDMLLVSVPLLKLLDDAEEKAIFAHEMAHVVYRHSLYGIVIGVMVYIASVLVPTYFWLTCATYGLHILVIAIAVWMAARWISAKFLPGWMNQMKILPFVALYGGMSVYNAAFLKVAVIVLVLNRLPRVCQGLYSQVCEYMADKAAVDLGADPLALAMALRKITFLKDRAQQKFRKGKPLSKDGLLNAYFQLYSTHPPVESRVEKLCHIACFKQGIPWDDMQKVRRGAIDLPADHDIPDNVVQRYMKI